MVRIKNNTKGKTKSRGDIVKDVRQKLGNPTFKKIIKIVVNTKIEDLKNLLAEIEVPRFGTFIVGKVFQHRVEGCVPQYHWDSFKNLLLNDVSNLTVQVTKDVKNLSKYILPQSMDDTGIQNKTKSNPMEEKCFWATLYCFIVKPELGKKRFNYELRKDKFYIFHVRKKKGKVVVFRIYWNDNEWRLSVFEFDTGAWWSQGDVFFFTPLNQ